MTIAEFDKHWCLIKVSQKEKLELQILYAYIRSPSKNHTESATEMINKVTQKIKDMTKVSAPLMIIGDLNARMGEIMGDAGWNPKGTEMWEVFYNSEIEILNKSFEFGEPTFYSDIDNSSSIVDIACVNKKAKNLIKDMKIVAHSAAISDHCPSSRAESNSY